MFGADPCDDWSKGPLGAFLKRQSLKVQLEEQQARVAYAQLMHDVSSWRMGPRYREALEREQKRLAELEREVAHA